MDKVELHETAVSERELLEKKEIFTAVTSLQLENALKLFGNSIALMTTPASPVDFVPLPGVTVGVEINDPVLVKKTLLHILNQNEIPFGVSSLNGVQLYFWGDHMQKGLQPSYAIHDDTLYLSNSTEMLQNVITTAFNGHGMTAQDHFRKSTGDYLNGDCNSICYIRVPVFLNTLKNLVNWVGTILALDDKKAAHRTKVVVENIVIPVIDGLTMYADIATRSTIDAGVITIESEILFEQEQSWKN